MSLNCLVRAEKVANLVNQVRVTLFKSREHLRYLGNILCLVWILATEFLFD